MFLFNYKYNSNLIYCHYDIWSDVFCLLLLPFIHTCSKCLKTVIPNIQTSWNSINYFRVIYFQCTDMFIPLMHLCSWFYLFQANKPHCTLCFCNSSFQAFLYLFTPDWFIRSHWAGRRLWHQNMNISLKWANSAEYTVNLEQTRVCNEAF